MAAAVGMPAAGNTGPKIKEMKNSRGWEGYLRADFCEGERAAFITLNRKTD